MNNILTQCPAQTCLAVGSSNHVKGIRDLPARTKSSSSNRRRLDRLSKTAGKYEVASSSSSSNSVTCLHTKRSPRQTALLTNDTCVKNDGKNKVNKTSIPRKMEAQRNKTLLNHLSSSLPPTSALDQDFPSQSSFMCYSPPSKLSTKSNIMEMMEKQRQGGSGDAIVVGLQSTSSAWDAKDEYSFHKNGSEKVRCIALPLLKQRLGYLWEKKMFTDVVFMVGRNKTKIEAHRVILASASEIFQSLLYNEGKPLIVDDKFLLYENEFSEPSFEVFIKAMYTNEIPICLTLALALEVFYASKKYQVIFLEDQILEHIRQLLTVSNVFEALRFSTNALELMYLTPNCWKIIEEQTGEVLEYHLDSLDQHIFARILERDRLSLDEVELFQYAIRWAAHLCKLQGIKTTGRNKRQFMEPLLKHFRFTTMTPTQFSNVVIPSRILEMKEVQQIQNVFHKVPDPSRHLLPYKTVARVNTTLALLKSQESLLHNSSSASNPGNEIEIPTICSDSAVITPSLSSRMHLKKAPATPTKPKSRRAASNRGRCPQTVR